MARIVIALGGNALGNNPTEQKKMIDVATPSLIHLIEQGNEIVLSHGNGPQVGMIQLAFDIASNESEKVVSLSLEDCTAMSQGYIGYHLQQGVKKELRNQKMPWNVATIITQVIVDKNDPAFTHPNKPIGAFYSKVEIEEMSQQIENFHYIEDSGRGFRQVVASPKPIDIAERESILNLLDNEYIVIACGGGGIPVFVNENGDYESVSAVIDKDFASAKLAEDTNADFLFILTAVDRVALNYGTPEQIELKEMSVKEAETFIAEGHFAPGSMLPKVEAAIAFVKSGKGRKAVIGSLEKAPLALVGKSGTMIYLDEE